LYVEWVPQRGVSAVGVRESYVAGCPVGVPGAVLEGEFVDVPEGRGSGADACLQQGTAGVDAYVEAASWMVAVSVQLKQVPSCL